MLRLQVVVQFVSLVYHQLLYQLVLHRFWFLPYSVFVHLHLSVFDSVALILPDLALL